MPSLPSLVLAGLLVAAAPQPPDGAGPTVAAPWTVLRNLVLVDGRGGPPEAGAEIEIQGGRIVRVGRESDPPPAGARVVLVDRLGEREAVDGEAPTELLPVRERELVDVGAHAGAHRHDTVPPPGAGRTPLRAASLGTTVEMVRPSVSRSPS